MKKYHCTAAVDGAHIPLVDNAVDLTIQGYLALATCTDNTYLNSIESDAKCTCIDATLVYDF
jgi:hypothetical protein